MRWEPRTARQAGPQPLMTPGSAPRALQRRTPALQDTEPGRPGTVHGAAGRSSAGGGGTPAADRRRAATARPPALDPPAAPDAVPGLPGLSVLKGWRAAPPRAALSRAPVSGWGPAGRARCPAHRALCLAPPHAHAGMPRSLSLGMLPGLRAELARAGSRRRWPAWPCKGVELVRVGGRPCMLSRGAPPHGARRPARARPRPPSRPSPLSGSRCLRLAGRASAAHSLPSTHYSSHHRSPQQPKERHSRLRSEHRQALAAVVVLPRQCVQHVRLWQAKVSLAKCALHALDTRLQTQHADARCGHAAAAVEHGRAPEPLVTCSSGRSARPWQLPFHGSWLRA